MINLIKNLLKPYYRLFEVKELKSNEIKILQSDSNKELKEIIKKFCKLKTNENLSLIMNGSRSDEQRGAYMGAVRAFSELLTLFDKVEKQKHKPLFQDRLADGLKTLEKKLALKD